MASIDTERSAEITVKRSRFIALARPIATDVELKRWVAERRRTIRRARHHCWAVRFHDDTGRLVEHARDDGEVGRPGLKLLELLRHRDLEGAILVSRIFGGIKLGPAGVGRAFRQVGQAALLGDG